MKPRMLAASGHFTGVCCMRLTPHVSAVTVVAAAAINIHLCIYIHAQVQGVCTHLEAQWVKIVIVFLYYLF